MKGLFLSSACEGADYTEMFDRMSWNPICISSIVSGSYCSILKGQEWKAIWSLEKDLLASLHRLSSAFLRWVKTKHDVLWKGEDKMDRFGAPSPFLFFWPRLHLTFQCKLCLRYAGPAYGKAVCCIPIWQLDSGSFGPGCDRISRSRGILNQASVATRGATLRRVVWVCFQTTSAQMKEYQTMKLLITSLRSQEVPWRPTMAHRSTPPWCVYVPTVHFNVDENAHIALASSRPNFTAMWHTYREQSSGRGEL